MHIYNLMALEKPKRWQRLGIFLRNKYRLVILNDSTFAEKFSLRLSPGSIIVGLLAITIVMTSLVISLVAFTPLREYIPGYGTIAERKQILGLTAKADSIEQVLEARDVYMNNVLNVFNDKLETKPEKPKKDTTGKYAGTNTNASKTDMEFRKDFENTRNNLVVAISNSKLKGLSELVFYTPIKGMIIASYNLSEDHFGVDIVSKAEEPVKSTLEGTVVFTGYSSEDGYVIHIQHSNNLTSIYKHNSELLKKTGERIKSGEAIAIVGNTGEKSNGPHLHFELWYNGIPINPQECVAF